jgi:hypothetical protein
MQLTGHFTALIHTQLRPELRTDGMKKDLPENLRGNPTFEDEKGAINNNATDRAFHCPHPYPEASISEGTSDWDAEASHG